MKALLTTIFFASFFTFCTEEIKQQNSPELIKPVEHLNKTEPKDSLVHLSEYIDGYNEIYLYQQDDKCGEWGGNIIEIKLYKSVKTGEILADYSKTIVECDSINIKNYKPQLIEKKSLIMNNKELKIAYESILELVDFKLSNSKRITHSGVFNEIKSKDSSLKVTHYPSNEWPKLKMLVKELKKK